MVGIGGECIEEGLKWAVGVCFYTKSADQGRHRHPGCYIFEKISAFHDPFVLWLGQLVFFRLNDDVVQDFQTVFYFTPDDRVGRIG